MLSAIGLVAFGASIAAAAPQLIQDRRAQVLPSSPPGCFPPPLELVTGGVHSLVPVSHPANGPEERTLSRRVSFDASAQARARLRHKARPLPKAKATPESVKNVLDKQSESPPDGYIPPPLEIKTADVRPLVPVERPAIKRDVQISPMTVQPTYAVVFPSAGATGIPVIEQHRLVTSFVPTTTCSSRPGEPTGEDGSFASDCDTSLVPTETAICATTLLPIGAEPIVVSQCDQYITYSSRLGYELVSCTAMVEPQCTATIQTLTTYNAAHWEQLTPGAAPTTGVEIVCSTGNICTSSTFLKPSPTPTAVSEVGDDHDGKVAVAMTDDFPTTAADSERVWQELRA